MATAMTSTSMHFLRSLSLSVGMALASSCLGLIAGLAGRAGVWLLPAIAVSGLIALAVAFAIGRLARRFPSALGVRTYVKAAFGNTASLFIVFAYLVMVVLVAGVESNLYAGIVEQVLPAVPAAATLPLVFAVVFALNALGHEASRRVQLVLVAGMLAGLLVLSVCALLQAPAGRWTALLATGRPEALPTAAVTAFFLFVGFEWVTSSQSPSRQAAAQLPMVLRVSVVVLATAYGLFAAAALAQLDAAQLGATRTPQLLMAGLLWGEAGRWVMLAVSTAAVLMAFNAGVLGASRLLYGLAREGVLPALLARTRGERAVPLNAIAATVAVALGCSAVARVLQAGDLLGSVAALLICLCYAGLLASSAVLARQEPKARFAVEALALIAMAVLLLAMCFDVTAWRATAAAAVVCIACALIARRVQPRRTPPPTFAAAAGRGA